jgi:hypothetical protein
MTILTERLVKQWHELDECDPYRDDVREAIDEIERLNDLRWSATANHDAVTKILHRGYQAKLTEAEAQIAVLRGALKRVEWAEYPDPGWGTQTFCPICRMGKKYGHLEGCEISIALTTPPRDSYLKQWLGEPVAYEWRHKSMRLLCEDEIEAKGYIETAMYGTIRPLYALPEGEE